MTPAEQLEKRNISDLMLSLLLNADGSTTKVIEFLIHKNVSVKVHEQEVIQRPLLPSEIGKLFPYEGPYLRRISSLYCGPKELSYNLVYANLDAIPSNYQEGLIKGDTPIGKVIKSLPSQRVLLWGGYKKADSLNMNHASFRHENTQHPVKEYVINNDNESYFYVHETFNIQQILSYFWAAISDRNYPLAV